MGRAMGCGRQRRQRPGKEDEVMWKWLVSFLMRLLGFILQVGETFTSGHLVMHGWILCGGGRSCGKGRRRGGHSPCHFLPLAGIHHWANTALHRTALPLVLSMWCGHALTAPLPSAGA